VEQQPAELLTRFLLRQVYLFLNGRMQSKFSHLASLSVAFSHFCASCITLCVYPIYVMNWLPLHSEYQPYRVHSHDLIISLGLPSVCLCLSHTLLPLPALFIVKTNNIYSNLCWLQEVYLSSRLSILILGPTHPPLQWVSWTLSPCLKRMECEADQLLPLNVKVTNDWSYTYTFPCAFITFRETTLPLLTSCLCPVVLFLVVFLITLNQM